MNTRQEEQEETDRPLTKERGVWVFRTGQQLTASATDEMLRQIRDERDLANATAREE